MKSLHIRRARVSAAAFAIAALALSGCSNDQNEETVTFNASDYEVSRGTTDIEDISIYQLPTVDTTSGLQTAFNQAVTNSQFLAENAGIIERTDFRDGEFMTLIFDPNEETTPSGFWYLRADGTSSFGTIFSAFTLGDDNYELSVKELDKVNEFVEREFSMDGENVIVIDFGGYFVYEYQLENDVIVSIRNVNEDNPDASPVTYLEYGSQEKLSAFSNKLNEVLGSQ